VLDPYDPGGMAAALAAGVDEWLTTPFSMQELVRRLQQLLTSPSTRHQAFAPIPPRSPTSLCVEAHAKLFFGRCPWCGEMVIMDRGD
jgi:DNA-binding response OmpR family regulator